MHSEKCLSLYVWLWYLIFLIIKKTKHFFIANSTFKQQKLINKTLKTATFTLKEEKKNSFKIKSWKVCFVVFINYCGKQKWQWFIGH